MAAHKEKMRTMMIGDRPAIIGDRVPESQAVKPISPLVRALPIARVPAHMTRLGQETPFDIASPTVNKGL